MHARIHGGQIDVVTCCKSFEGGVVLLKRTSDGVLKLRGYKLWRVNPCEAKTERADFYLLHEASERERWLQLVEEYFSLPLVISLSTHELDVLWERVSNDNARFSFDDPIY